MQQYSTAYKDALDFDELESRSLACSALERLAANNGQRQFQRMALLTHGILLTMTALSRPTVDGIDITC